MTKQDVLRKIAEVGLVPVVRAQSADEAMKVVDAIREGGVSVLEITMTVPGALGVMEQVARRFGADVVLGAGTVLDPETARACMLAGARFIVCPTLNPATIEMCRRYSVPIMPGALTPTEVLAAWTRIIAPLADRRPVGHPAQRPDVAVPVSFTLVAVPIPRTEQGG